MFSKELVQIRTSRQFRNRSVMKSDSGVEGFYSELLHRKKHSIYHSDIYDHLWHIRRYVSQCKKRNHHNTMNPKPGCSLSLLRRISVPRSQVCIPTDPWPTIIWRIEFFPRSTRPSTTSPPNERNSTSMEVTRLMTSHPFLKSTTNERPTRWTRAGRVAVNYIMIFIVCFRRAGRSSPRRGMKSPSFRAQPHSVPTLLGRSELRSWLLVGLPVLPDFHTKMDF